MNKKEDLMRRLPGERTDSKADLLKNSFILFFLIFSSQTFCQIPINGFCSQTNFSLPKGYDGVVSSDLNSDGFDELIFFATNQKQLCVYSDILTENNSFKEFQLSTEISQLRQLKEKSDNSRLFAAIDRKHRKILFMDISVENLQLRSNQIEFDSYPENIFSGDIDLDGREEIIVYGSGFDGLSILFRTNEGIGEGKIVSGTSFSEAVFIDFNNDGYLDVVAFNILENTLQFFTNNTSGIFRLNRSVQYSEKINLLKAKDLNNDELSDLIYTIGNKIEILYADYQSTFQNKKSIKLDDKPSGIVFGDFNNDKLTDISFSLDRGTLNILFAKKNLDFYESITYSKILPTGSFTSLNSTVSENIVFFSQSSGIGVITSAGKLKNNMKLVPAIEVSALKKFDYGNDNSPEISFVDKFDKNLKLFLLDKSGIPSSLYYIPLAEDHKEVVVDDVYKQVKTFYCYSEGAPLLEVFKFNFRTNKLNRKQLYAPGEILDLNLQRIDSSLVNVFVTYNKHSKLYLGKFENREQSITFKEYPFLDRNVSLAKIRVQDEPEVFYWKSERDTFYFKMVDLEPGPNLYTSYYNLPKTENSQINLYGANLFFNNYPSIVSIVQNDSLERLFLVNGERLRVAPKFFNDEIQQKHEFGRGYFGEMVMKGIINFSVNTIDDDYINTLIYSEKEKNYILSRTISAIDVSDYFFLRIDQKSYYLVYSNTEGDLLIASTKK